jgi:hypothetical protein
MSRFKPYLLIAAAVSTLTLPVAGSARPWGGGGWGDPFGGYGGGYGGGFDGGRFNGPDRSREGRISVERFVSHDPLAAALGHGSIVVSSQSPGDAFLEEAGSAVFEAAMIDRLVKAGYETKQTQPDGGQALELMVARSVLEPAERKKPISGEAAIEASNHGMGYGLAVNVDLSKPLPPLIITRLQVRILDRATQTVLWEGHAEVATREGAKGWSDQDIASRLAAALLNGFPHASDGIKRAG